MPILERKKTVYPGVFYIDGTCPATGKKEKIFYIRYRKAGKMIEEKAGRQSKDMTAARASVLRAEKIKGKKPSRQEVREQKETAKKAEAARWTINRLWQEYTAQRQLKGIAQDRSRFEKYIKTSWGEKEPHEIQPLEVDRLRLRILKDKAPQTAKLTLSLLRRIVNFGVKRHLCKPFSFHLEMPKVNNLKTEDLSPEQFIALLKAIEQDPNLQAANFMKMALFTGMRRGELFRLQWQDVDFERGFIHICNPKGGIDQKIPLNATARELLINHPRTGSLFVFPGRGGNQRVDINKQVTRIKAAAGLPKDFRALHGLRHTYASMLASSGQVDLYTLQKLLTHKSAAMTQRYAHLRDEALHRASDVAGDLLNLAMNRDNAKVANLRGEE
ncbi:MAG: tyrosine-type recombinase/integrase [Desulfobaccales bacterium]